MDLSSMDDMSSFLLSDRTNQRWKGTGTQYHGVPSVEHWLSFQLLQDSHVDSKWRAGPTPKAVTRKHAHPRLQPESQEPRREGPHVNSRICCLISLINYW